MNSDAHFNQATFSVLMSLAGAEPSSTVSLQGKVGALQGLLQRSIQPELLSLLVERSQHFMRVELDVDALGQQLEEVAIEQKERQALIKTKDVLFRLMAADASFPMMSSLFNMTQHEYAEWRRENKEVASQSSAGGKLRKARDGEESAMRSKFVELNASKRDWVPGEMFLAVHLETGIPVRIVWRFACEKGIV